MLHHLLNNLKVLSLSFNFFSSESQRVTPRRGLQLLGGSMLDLNKCEMRGQIVTGIRVHSKFGQKATQAP